MNWLTRSCSHPLRPRRHACQRRRRHTYPIDAPVRQQGGVDPVARTLHGSGRREHEAAGHCPPWARASQPPLSAIRRGLEGAGPCRPLAAMDARQLSPKECWPPWAALGASQSTTTGCWPPRAKPTGTARPQAWEVSHRPGGADPGETHAFWPGRPPTQQPRSPGHQIWVPQS